VDGKQQSSAMRGDRWKVPEKCVELSGTACISEDLYSASPGRLRDSCVILAAMHCADTG
jgi:hypothetical protein